MPSGRSNERPMSRTPWPPFRTLRGLTAADLNRDLGPGLTLAAIAIPEQMATARLGGFSPQIGFFAFFAGSLGFAMFGSNRFLSCGADSTITPIFAGGLVLMAASGSPDYQALAVALALMVGVILMAGSLFRLGWIANLLSTPVTTGFLAGIAVHILVSQMPGVLGLSAPKGPMLDRIAELAQHAGEANLYTVGIGLGVLGVVAASEAISAKIPGALIGLIGATAAVVWAGLESKGVHVVGAVPAMFPVRPRQAGRRRPRFSRRRRRQRACGIVRRVSRQCQPTANWHRIRDRRTHAAVRTVRRDNRTGAVGVRRHAVAPRSGGGTGRRAVVRGAADHSPQADRHDLPAIARRIPADRRHRGRDHRAADRTRRGRWHRAVAAARHLDHHTRRARRVRARQGHHDLVAGQSGYHRRPRSASCRRRIAGAAVVPQRSEFSQ